MGYSSGARFSRAKPTGRFRVLQPSTRRVASHSDSLREARVDAEYWIKAGAKSMEIQERFPSGKWVTVETVTRESAPMDKRSHATRRAQSRHATMGTQKSKSGDREWVFTVEDDEGLWGELRVFAPTEQQAKTKARRHLQKELEPKGSLGPGFRLRLSAGSGSHATKKSPATERVGIDVAFRVFPEGDVIALFPKQDEGRGQIGSYQHLGQHGGADRSLLRLKKATPSQYASLLAELKSIGYVPRILK